MVFVMVLIMSIFFLLVDMLLGGAIEIILGIGG
jgi:preprotein translocase subunit SecE